jgi:hypothetical protein
MKASDFNQWKGYNSISIPAGKQVVYKLLNIRPDIESGNGAFIIPSTNIPTTDTIFRDGNVYAIGCFTGTQANGDPIHDTIIFDPSTAGKVVLTSGNPGDERKFRYLERSNYNDSNPDRVKDGVKEPLFFRVDEALDAETELKQDKIKYQAEAKFWEIESNTKLLKDAFLIVGIDDADLSLAKKKLKDYVTRKPTEFMAIYESSSQELDSLAIVKKALKDGILKDDREKKAITYGEDNIDVHYYFNKNVNHSELTKDLEENKKDVFDAIALKVLE